MVPPMGHSDKEQPGRLAAPHEQNEGEQRLSLIANAARKRFQ